MIWPCMTALRGRAVHGLTDITMRYRAQIPAGHDLKGDILNLIAVQKA